ncbi:hypothetical protein Micbo1qcDRAFT_13906 [Microdochium bolleyi]|uniref:NACHT domain-containing protein n=1 Tax=Microdochium bolleyi TaxID=196109 RepID=A0A136IVV0_9PEZI|nr:hypothetical protein Micbo1qcDRAFT_13906 [Microdochium bolleyi]
MRAEPSHAGKTSHSDWSEPELQGCLDTALKKTRHIVYIFLDGLDEIQTSSIEQLMLLIHQFRRHPNVKLCVSSRPEPIFERTLQQYPHLRLHELNRMDIEHYVKQKLRDLSSYLPPYQLSSDDIATIARCLVDRSDGVFLWVQLVTRSLMDGASNHDSLQLLWNRIREIPDDLEALYRSMLDRRDRNTKVYRDFASTFFALVLLDDHFRATLIGDSFNMRSPLAITLYVNPDLTRRAIEHKNAKSLSEELLRRVVQTCDQMRISCAGLLDLPTKFDTTEPVEIVSDESISFIHRTARDFMLDQGRNIWQQAMPNLVACLDVQHAIACLKGRSIQPTGLFCCPSRFDLDYILLSWCCNRLITQDQRGILQELLMRKMVEEELWTKDKRNPCVLGYHGGFDHIIPQSWWESWAPTGMTRYEFLVRLHIPDETALPKAAIDWLLAKWGIAP